MKISCLELARDLFGKLTKKTGLSFELEWNRVFDYLLWAIAWNKTIKIVISFINSLYQASEVRTRKVNVRFFHSFSFCLNCFFIIHFFSFDSNVLAAWRLQLYGIINKSNNRKELLLISLLPSFSTPSFTSLFR